MKKILLSLLIVISFTNFTNFIRAQAPDTLWTKQITFLNDGWPADILPTSQGGCLLVVNFSHPVTNQCQICILSIHKDGFISKLNYIGDDGSNDVRANHISPTSDGGAIIAGTFSYYNGHKTFLVRIDSEGDTVWTKTYLSWPDMNEGRRAIQTKTGFVILSLAQNAQSIYYDLLIVTDQSGNYLNARPFFDEGNLYPADMLKTFDNCFVVLSRLETVGNNKFITLFKTDITGFQYWNRYLVIPGYQNYASASTLKQSIDNRFLIGGTINPPSYFRLGFLAKTHPNGELSQYHIYGDATTQKQIWIESFIEMPDQGILSSGMESFYSNNSNMMIMRTNSQMDTVYCKDFIFPDVTWSEMRRIQKCPDGNNIVCGRIDFSNSSAVFVAKIGSDIPSVVINNSNLGLAITDNNVTTDIINFVGLNKSQASMLLGIDVMIDTVLHTSTGDLEFTLSHNGIIDTLIYHAGESGDNFIQTILSDVAQSPVDLASAPFTGFYRSTSSLSKFSGVDPTGDWTLSILDNALGNTGMLNSWGLRFYFEGPVGVDDETPDVISDYKLYQNYPNPFNPSTRIQYQVSSNSQVVLKIYDVLGNEIATLVNEEKPAGSYEVEFNTSNINPASTAGGHHPSSGVYFCRLSVVPKAQRDLVLKDGQTENYSKTIKMMYLK